MDNEKIVPIHTYKEERVLTFEEFYNENYIQAFFYTKKKINNYSDAEDIVSDAFFYCYQNFSNYDSKKSSYKTWLYLILNSRIKNYYRDHKIHIEWSELDNILFDENNDINNGIFLEQIHKQLLTAIRLLDEKYQTVIVGRYFEDKSYDEIAMKLGTTSGNVRVIHNRAMHKLRKICDSLINEF